MQAGLPPDSRLHAKVAALLMRVPDFQDALAQYREALRLDHKNRFASRGAGHAAFELGLYGTALHYLESSSDKSQDADADSIIQMSRLMLATDPFLRNLSSQERHARMLRAFEAAEQRLHSCMGQHGESQAGVGTSNASVLQDLDLRGQQLRRRLRSPALLNSSDFSESLMDFVFTTESSAQQECGEPTGADKALLLMARNREKAGQ
jgi:tetratricopeptide (TPR) repeat protein